MNKIPEKQANAATESWSSSLNTSTKICVQNPEVELEPRQTSKIELFAKIVNDLTSKMEFFVALVNVN